MFKLTLFIIVLFSASLKAQTDQVSEIKDSFAFFNKYLPTSPLATVITIINTASQGSTALK